MEDRIEAIYEGLRQKSTTKQAIFRNTKEAFDQLRACSVTLVDILKERVTKVDANVIIEYRSVNEFEFHIKFSGDLLIFIMHSNIITLPEDHELMKSRYVEEDFRRRFFGHIMAYNFMADSIKYNRLNDPGYLLGRILINIDNHFYLEGVKQLDLTYNDMAHNKLDPGILRLLVESAMIASVNNDLVAPDVDEIRKITVKQKLEEQQVSTPQKVGFSFSYQRTPQMY
ncbi:hypothetical protein TH63_11110 [Rufibacter radiotolerans]|uniref:Uncharacterized protein n=1 Tax=Rufibacter radiotolerans TaxID=1379910 RepID=A0A0H4VQ81_9BACT|nr:hypothetical protein [Rufibacter radiotolerans]AKQ46062.1 hypothetical protein TH63_11110 [Rufibacter radiotolerans]